MINRNPANISLNGLVARSLTTVLLACGIRGPDDGDCLAVIDSDLRPFVATLSNRACGTCDSHPFGWARGLRRMPDGTMYAWLSDSSGGYNTVFYAADGRQVAYRACGDAGVPIPPECQAPGDTAKESFCTWKGLDLRAAVVTCEDRSACDVEPASGALTLPDSCGLAKFFNSGLPSSCLAP